MHPPVQEMGNSKNAAGEESPRNSGSLRLRHFHHAPIQSAVISSRGLDQDHFFACLGPSLTDQQMHSPNLFLGYGRADEPNSEGCLLSTFSPTRVSVLSQALQTKNLLQILAEPNLIAVNGKEASFLAGGQFPFPLVQPGQGFTAVTISFKDFGVKLQFTPVIMPNGNIHLKVAPEVSTLDFSNALTISGFTVPALSTRKAETEFELQDGQSFVIAGLMDNRVTDIYSKVPGLGDIPILGNFFRSKSLQKNNSELMVLCTVRRISPSGQAPPPPTTPQPFLNPGKFDKTNPAGIK